MFEQSENVAIAHLVGARNYPAAVFKPFHTKTLYQTQTPPLHVTNISQFDQSEAIFEMSCGIIGSQSNYLLCGMWPMQ